MGDPTRDRRRNRALKRQAQRYQAEHGVSYTQALRAVTSRAVTRKRRGPRNRHLQFLRRNVARCGNPACGTPLRVENSAGGDVFIGEVCHIRAVASGGPRWNADRRTGSADSIGNLIVLCPNCHVRIDQDSASYGVGVLEEWWHHQMAPLLAVEPGVHVRLVSVPAAKRFPAGVSIDDGDVGLDLANDGRTDVEVVAVGVDLGGSEGVHTFEVPDTVAAKPDGVLKSLTSRMVRVDRETVVGWHQEVLRAEGRSADRVRAYALLSTGDRVEEPWHRLPGSGVIDN